jgi:hypothetical protein
MKKTKSPGCIAYEVFKSEYKNSSDQEVRAYAKNMPQWSKMTGASKAIFEKIGEAVLTEFFDLRNSVSGGVLDTAKRQSTTRTQKKAKNK